MFLWQLPHFLAIAWMYREDYARAGLPMLPVVDRTARHGPAGGALGGDARAVQSAAVLFGLTGNVYAVGALRPRHGTARVGDPVRAAAGRIANARPLFYASITYLPLLWLLMVRGARVTVESATDAERHAERDVGRPPDLGLVADQAAGGSRRTAGDARRPSPRSALFLTSYVIYHAQVGSQAVSRHRPRADGLLLDPDPARHPRRGGAAAGDRDPAPRLDSRRQAAQADREDHAADLAVRVGDGSDRVPDAVPDVLAGFGRYGGYIGYIGATGTRVRQVPWCAGCGRYDEYIGYVGATGIGAGAWCVGCDGFAGCDG